MVTDVLFCIIYILSHGYIQLYISFHIKMSKNTLHNAVIFRRTGTSLYVLNHPYMDAQMFHLVAANVVTMC